MTPKEEAMRLVGQHYDLFVKDNDEFHNETAWRIAIKSALITVNELIQNVYDTDYWIYVKQEMEKTST